MLGCSVIVMEMNYCRRNVMCVGTTLTKGTEGDLRPSIKTAKLKIKTIKFLLEILFLDSSDLVNLRS